MYKTILLAAAILTPLNVSARAEVKPNSLFLDVQATCVDSITACPNSGNTSSKKCVRDSGSGSAGHWWSHVNCDGDAALEWLRLDSCTCQN